jgi:lipoprotein-releasing system ATP-binding protein
MASAQNDNEGGRRGDGAPTILVRGLVRIFEKDTQVIEVLRGIDLEVKQGETLAITGASGVGKSTLVHLLGALDRPTAGTVLYEGDDIFRLDDDELAGFRNRKVGFIFQFHHLLAELTALENVMMPALINGMSRARSAALAREMLGRLGLENRLKHKPGELSGGEQQRVAIARALILRPPLVLADEPTGNLDRRTGEGVEDMLLDMNRELQANLVVVTHNLRLAAKMDRQLELIDGRLAEWGTGEVQQGDVE